MNAPNPWSKFFWNDWENDPALRLCSLAAQGLWMRLLCIAAKSSPTGFVAVAGRPCSSTDIALLTGASEQEVESLLGELSRNGVFSRDVQGRIYSRRMVRDYRKSVKNRQNGAKGGQASFLNEKGIFSPRERSSEQPSERGAEPQKPESRVHKPEFISPPQGPPVAPPPKKPKAAVSALAADWSLPDTWRKIASNRGWRIAAIEAQAVKFKQYFLFGKGVGKKRSDIGWQQTWINWLDRELKLYPDAATFGDDGETFEANKPTSESRLPEDVRAELKSHYAFTDNFIQRWLEVCSFDLESGIIKAPSAFHANYLENNYGDAISRALGREMRIVVRKIKSPEGAL